MTKPYQASLQWSPSKEGIEILVKHTLRKLPFRELVLHSILYNIDLSLFLGESHLRCGSTGCRKTQGAHERASRLSNSNRGRAAAGVDFAAGIRRFQQNLEKSVVAGKLASPSVSLSKSLFRQAESRILAVAPYLLRTRFLLHPQLNRGFSLACPANKEKRGAGECPLLRVQSAASQHHRQRSRRQPQELSDSEFA